MIRPLQRAQAWEVHLGAVPAAAGPAQHQPPAPPTISELWGVSCTSASACTAVGHKAGDTGSGTLAEAWNGVAWTVQPTPNPTGATSSSLYAVSCTSASACTAVGYSVIGSVYEPLAEVWNGTAWTIQPVPAPTGAVVTGLAGVSCTSASACIATGDYVTGSLTSTDYTALVEVWDGTTWTVQPTPNESGAANSLLDGVSCTSTSACTSTGWYQTAAGGIETLAEVWNGTAWTIQPTPDRTGATSSYLFSVSCTAPSVCKAAGYDLSPSYTALAEGINGTTWSVQSTPTA